MSRPSIITITFLAFALFLSSCVTLKTYRHDVLAHYKKGLKVGRVIGRDEVLFKLRSPECFQQPVDDLMSPSPFDDLAEQAAKETDAHFRDRERQLGIR